MNALLTQTPQESPDKGFAIGYSCGDGRLGTVSFLDAETVLEAVTLFTRAYPSYRIVSVTEDHR